MYTSICIDFQTLRLGISLWIYIAKHENLDSQESLWSTTTLLITSSILRSSFVRGRGSFRTKLCYFQPLLTLVWIDSCFIYESYKTYIRTVVNGKTCINPSIGNTQLHYPQPNIFEIRKWKRNDVNWELKSF